jgi:hypothetical protein
MADFVDAFAIGEGEEVIVEVALYRAVMIIPTSGRGHAAQLGMGPNRLLSCPIGSCAAWPVSTVSVPSL